MKKMMMAAAVACAAISTGAMAQPTWFVGGLYGQSKLDTSVSSSPEGEAAFKYGLKKIEKPDIWGARVGVYLNPNFRTYFTYTDGKEDKSYSAGSNYLKTENKNTSYLLSADYLFANYPVKPFAGLTIGANEYEAKIKGAVDGGAGSISKSETGLAYGGQVGVNWSPIDNFDIELGYQYLLNDNKLSFYGDKVKLDHTQTAYLAVDYRF